MHNGGLDFVQILLESGLVVKAVLIILVLLSITSWAIIFQKRKTFKGLKKDNNTFYNNFNACRSVEELLAEPSNISFSTFKEMSSKAVGELLKVKKSINAEDSKLKISTYFKENGTDAVERSLQLGASQSNLVLEHKLSTLASISSVAPFIGLFGTVWGIIDAFSGLATGGGSIEAVAPGIAEALIATAVGLAAAIPANWFFNIFTTEISAQHSEMENFGQEFLNLMDRTYLGQDQGES